jgi:hypothetical protein
MEINTTVLLLQFVAGSFQSKESVKQWEQIVSPSPGKFRAAVHNRDG